MAAGTKTNPPSGLPVMTRPAVCGLGALFMLAYLFGRAGQPPIAGAESQHAHELQRLLTGPRELRYSRMVCRIFPPPWREGDPVLDQSACWSVRHWRRSCRPAPSLHSVKEVGRPFLRGRLAFRPHRTATDVVPTTGNQLHCAAALRPVQPRGTEKDSGLPGHRTGLLAPTTWRTMESRLKKGICIAVGNQKGGVGKTTTAVHLATALSMRGHTCLLMDLDPSAGATKHLGVHQNSYAGALELLTTEEPLEALVVTEGLPERLHLLPARPQLAELDSMLSKFVDRTRVLDRALAAARHLYDFIIIDTPPSAGAVTTVAAYSAAEWFLLAAFPHPLALAGLSEACRDIADVRARRNPELEVLGVVFTNVDGRTRKLRVQLDDLVQSLMPGRRFRTAVSQAVVIPTMSGLGKTVFENEHSERLLVARQFKRLADEVEHRTLHRDQFLGGTLGEPPGWNTPALLAMADDLLEAHGQHA